MICLDVCYFGGLFYIILPLPVWDHVVQTESSITHIFFSSGKHCLSKMTILCGTSKILWFTAKAHISEHRISRQVKLFGFLCFVLFVSSNLCDYPIADTYSVKSSSFCSGTVQKCSQVSNFYSSLVPFCFLTLKTGDQILILLISLADIALLSLIVFYIKFLNSYLVWGCWGPLYFYTWIE